MPVKNRLAILMAERSIQKQRRITLSEIADEADVSHTTLTKYMQQRATRFDGDVLEKLCKYFGVQVDKLIYVDPDPSHAKQES